jgi:hypothetical protein
MNTANPFVLPLSAVTLLALVLLVAAVARALQARQRATRRVVEKPNSEYTWQAVRQREQVSRWHGIDVDALHEANRAEVRRLLDMAEAAGADALRPAERTFLDTVSAWRSLSA